MKLIFPRTAHFHLLTLLAPLFLSSAVAQESPTPLTDAEIAHILTTANQLEVEAGKLAAEKAATKEVKAYAKRMVNDHSRSSQQTAAITRKAKITPRENSESRSLREEAKGTMKRLQALQGEDFDRAYIGSQLSMHQRVLRTIDTLLLPQARNPELRAALQQTRPAVQQHFQHARQMSGGPSTGDNRERPDIRAE